MNHHPRILVAGCGYTGERCADFFCADGCDVTALVSSPESKQRLQGKPYDVIVANAADPAELGAALAHRAKPGILIHCLSGKSGRDADAYRVTYIETLRNLLDILAPGFCVFTGSTSVYTQNDGSIVTEESPCGGTPAADVLLEAEATALAAGGSVVRLGGIYGPGRTRFLDAALSGAPPPAGSGDSFINLIHRDDAARALAHAANLRLHGIYNAVDDHPMRRSDLTESLRTNRLVQGDIGPQRIIDSARIRGHGRPGRRDHDTTGGPPARGALRLGETPVLPASVQRTNSFATWHDTAPPPTGRRVNNAKLRATGWRPLFPSMLDALRGDPGLRTLSKTR